MRQPPSGRRSPRFLRPHSVPRSSSRPSFVLRPSNFVLLRVEPLEDRRMLSVFAVNSLADVVAADGLITLREALQAANTNTAVYDAPAGSATEADKIIIFAQDPVDPSSSRITLSGTQLDILDDVEIYGPGADRLSIDGNQKSRVFHVAADVEASLWGLTITGGKPTTGDGGGIRNLGTLTVDNSTISGNFATNSYDNGGGIYNSGTLSVNRSTLSGNSAGDSGGAIFGERGTVTVTDSTILDNSAEYSGGGICGDYGSTVTVTDCSLLHNLGERGSGGGICTSGTLIVTNCTLSGNSATRGGGIKSGILTITGSTLSENSAASDGGGIYSEGAVTITNTIISQNSAQGDGGGIYNDRTTTIIDSTITDNSAVGSGGGICGGSYGDFYSTLIINNSTLSNNSAGGTRSGNGGGICTYSRLTIGNSVLSGNSAYDGAGIWAAYGPVSVENSTLSNNSARNYGGGICNYEATLTITNSTLAGNSSASQLYNGGGAIWCSQGFLNVKSSTFLDNSATMCGGGGIGAVSTRGTIIDSTFAGNSASRGGGILAALYGTLSLLNCTVSGNVGQYGGGVLNDSYNTMTVMNCTLEGNTATYGGGGISNPRGTLTVTNSTVFHNSAGCGGGICASNQMSDSGTITLNNSVVAGNTAPLAPDVYLGYGVFSGTCNLIGNGSGQSALVNGSNGNIVGTSANPIDAMLGPLANSGGATLTCAPLPGSPVIDAGSGAAAVDASGKPLVRDQRGLRRQYGIVDIGAVEYQPPGPPTACEDLLELHQGSPLTIDTLDLTGNDRCDDGSPLAVEVMDGPTHGTLVANPDGSLTYTPEETFWGIDTFTYRAVNGLFESNVAEVRLSVLSTDGVLVTTAHDEQDGDLSPQDISLREALSDLHAPRIQFSINLAGQTIVLSWGSLDVSGVQIAGLGTDLLAISGNRRSGIFNVTGGEPTVSHLTLTNGRADKGGAIYVSSSGATLTVADCALTDNGNSYDNGYGGAIYNSGTLTILDSVISGNSGTDYGGGVYNAGVMSIFDSTISGNRASGADSSGGGIANSGTLTISRCTLSNNSAGSYGGGINNWRTLLIDSSTLSGNSIGGNGYYDSGGGGISNSGTLAVTNSTLSGNKVTGGRSCYGGGIYSRQGTASVTGSTLSGNLAEVGGGIYVETELSVVDCAVVGNSADSGGGIHGGDVNISNSTVTGNRAYEKNGGGIECSNAVITHSTISDNSANGYGGGVCCGDTSTIINSVISDNSATKDGGGVFGRGTITGSVLSGNSAGRHGGGLHSNGIYTISGSTLSDNRAGGDGGGMYTYGEGTLIGCSLTGNEAAGNGGAVYTCTTLTIANAVISGNIAAGSGGGVLASGWRPVVTMTNSTVSGNSAANGGGIGISDGTLSVVNSVFVGNSAVGNGGGILSDASALTLTNSTVVANVSDTKGGGVYSSGGTLAVANSILTMNQAPASADLYGILGAGSGAVLLGMDPGFVRTPSDGGDGWGDDPATADIDEGANDDFGNLRLREDGPAVNAGINGLVVDGAGGALATDRDGKQRIIYGTVDIGAYEFCLVGDADYSGTVDGGDAAVLAAHWGEGEMHWGDGDFNGDGRVNAADAAILAANWGAAFSPPGEEAAPTSPAVRETVVMVGPMARSTKYEGQRTKYEGQGTKDEVQRTKDGVQKAKEESIAGVAPRASASSVVRQDLGNEATDAVLAEAYGPAVEQTFLARQRLAWSNVLARRARGR